MAHLIQAGKYQVLEVLEEQDGYKTYLCIDVESNNHYKPLVFNVYERDEDIRRFLPAFFSLKQEQFKDFVRVMSGKHQIIAVFEYHEGDRLKDFFNKKPAMPLEERCKYCYKLLEECLILDAAEDFIASSCLQPDHIVISELSQRVMVNFIIRPQEMESGSSKGKKLANLLDCIFIKDRYTPALLWEYIESLRKNEAEDVGTAFSRWKDLNINLMKEYEKLQKENMLAYLWRQLKSKLRRKK